MLNISRSAHNGPKGLFWTLKVLKNRYIATHLRSSNINIIDNYSLHIREAKIHILKPALIEHLMIQFTKITHYTYSIGVLFFHEIVICFPSINSLKLVFKPNTKVSKQLESLLSVYAY